MARIRLNNEYRNKIANRIKVHLQQEDTQEKRKWSDCRTNNPNRRKCVAKKISL